ncbi:MAG: hypothetical protein NC098_09420 [Lachnoclostridium sp.]|nr:hypothetical protein [Lachnoclostridium sp.]
MKQFHFVVLLSIIFSSCSQTEELDYYNNEDSKILYEKLSQIPTSQLFSNEFSRTSGRHTHFNFTESDADSLFSMSQEDLIQLRNDILSVIGENAEDKIDDLYDENYSRILKKMNGPNGIDKLISYTDSYMKSPGGWNIIDKLLPENLSNDKKMFI